MEFKEGDRVIYDGCPCVIQRHNKSEWPPKRRSLNGYDAYILDPLEWDKDYPYINTWVSGELIQLDYQYYRNEKINSVLDGI